jgi:hypothetical protein
MLTDPKLPAAELSNLRFLSPQLADALLSSLMTQKKLDIHSLKRITTRCTLESVVMDSYRLATDSVMAILGTTAIRKLSLRGCGYVTDDGVKSLAPLAKTLTYLDLSNVKVTDKAAPVLATMKNLVHLDLSSTKITTSGVRTVAKGLGGDGAVLETLVLALCAGVMGNSIFEDLKRGWTFVENSPVGRLVDSIFNPLRFHSTQIPRVSLACLDAALFPAHPTDRPAGRVLSQPPNPRCLADQDC